MRKVIVLILTFTAYLSHSQEYKIVAEQSAGFTVKSGGLITISDSLIVFKTTHKNVNQTLDYNIINKRNGIIYFTDGIKTHELFIESKSGKKKGQKYTHVFTSTYETAQGPIIVISYTYKEE